MARIKSITIIEDPILEPFYLKSDRDCFTVLERVNSDPNHRLSKGDSKEGFKIIGYYTKFEDCINKICTQKLQLGQNFESLREYLDEYKKISETIKSYKYEI